MPATAHDHTGIVMEVRDDSFSLKTDEGSTIWFSYSPSLKAESASEIVTGNRLTVTGTPGSAPDRMNATRIQRADADIAVADRDVDRDVDVDVDVDRDNDSVTATLDTDRDVDNDRIADNNLRNDKDTYDNDNDELPQTASSLPAIGSLGLLALLGAAAISVGRRF